MTNPYVGEGIPTLGDVQSPIYNPLFSLPIFFLSKEWDEENIIAGETTGALILLLMKFLLFL